MNLAEEVIVAINSGNQKFHTNSQTVNFANYKIINSFSKLKTEQSQNDGSSDKLDLEEDKPEITNVNYITENRIELDYNLTLPESENKNVPENEKSTEIPEKELNRFQDIRETLHTNEMITNKPITDANEEMETLHTNEIITNEPITDTKEEMETLHTNEIITNEPITDTKEEMEMINNETDSKCDVRFVISERLPSLVGYNLSSFNDICTKGCDWSPSGEKLLVAAEDARFRIFSTPSLSDKDNIEELEPIVMLKETEMLYSWTWIPGDKERLLSTGRYQPIHLWDTNTGTVIDSYKCYDQVDEVTSAYSITQVDNQSFLVGLKNEITMFRYDRPGRENQCIAKSNRNELGKIGIVSCLDYSPETGLLAAGSYNKTVNIFNLDGKYLVYSLTGHSGGVTQVKFSSDGYRLYTGARKDNQLFAWDTRNMNTHLFTFHREVATNQRIEFDLIVEEQQQLLFSGGTDGVIRVWDTLIGEIVGGYMLHPDSIPGCGLHPSRPLLATTSGQRHPDQVISMDEEIITENSLKVWDFGKRLD